MLTMRMAVIEDHFCRFGGLRGDDDCVMVPTAGAAAVEEAGAHCEDAGVVLLGRGL